MDCIKLHNKQLRMGITSVITLRYINFFALFRIIDSYIATLAEVD